MAKNKSYQGLNGKIGGLAVKGMIREVEQRMAAGMVVSAKASTPEEEARLAQIRLQNQTTHNSMT